MFVINVRLDSYSYILTIDLEDIDLFTSHLQVRSWEILDSIHIIYNI